MTDDLSDAQDNERYLVVDGRRWRREDPTIPQEVRAQLLSHLGRGRSGVRNATDEAERTAHRARVGAAKHGLGERGTPWWEQDADERRARWTAALAELEGMDG